MATITTLSRFSAAADNNSFEGKGIKSYTEAYAATSAWVAKDALLQHVCYAQLTGAMTINATLTALQQFSEVVVTPLTWSFSQLAINAEPPSSLATCPRTTRAR